MKKKKKKKKKKKRSKETNRWLNHPLWDWLTTPLILKGVITHPRRVLKEG
jgi:hypothetical protein